MRTASSGSQGSQASADTVVIPRALSGFGTTHAVMSKEAAACVAQRSPHFRPTMSKPLVPYATIDGATAGPGALVKHTARMVLYWLCVTVLLWSELYPPAEWRMQAILHYLVASSLVVPTLGYLSLLLRHYYGHTNCPATHEGAHPAAQTLSRTGVVGVETLMVVLAGLTLERLLF
jgi:hypothetical protein